MLAETIRRGRKYWLRLVVATQQVEDVVSSVMGRTILNICHTTLLLEMKSDEIRLAKETFDLTPGEVEFLKGCRRTDKYSDGLLLLGKQHVGLRVPKAPAGVHRLITAPRRRGREAGR